MCIGTRFRVSDNWIWLALLTFVELTFGLAPVSHLRPIHLQSKSSSSRSKFTGRLNPLAVQSTWIPIRWQSTLVAIQSTPKSTGSPNQLAVQLDWQSIGLPVDSEQSVKLANYWQSNCQSKTIENPSVSPIHSQVHFLIVLPCCYAY